MHVLLQTGAEWSLPTIVR